MENKRGQQTGISSIIALVIGIVVLVVVVLGVMGVFNPINKATGEIPDELEIAAQACAQYTGLKSSYCKFKERDIGEGLLGGEVWSNCDYVGKRYEEIAGEVDFEYGSIECGMDATDFCCSEETPKKDFKGEKIGDLEGIHTCDGTFCREEVE